MIRWCKSLHKHFNRMQLDVDEPEDMHANHFAVFLLIILGIKFQTDIVSDYIHVQNCHEPVAKYLECKIVASLLYHRTAVPPRTSWRWRQKTAIRRASSSRSELLLIVERIFSGGTLSLSHSKRLHSQNRVQFFPRYCTLVHFSINTGFVFSSVLPKQGFFQRTSEPALFFSGTSAAITCNTSF